jgi:alpha-D-glucose phosphate-specific phosphoglucomutase
MHKIKFGTDGWRAVIAEDFTFDNVRCLAQAISDHINQSTNTGKKIIVVGYDTRYMSKKYAILASEVFAANNIKVFLSKKYLPTPALSLAAKNISTDGGIMITASHNPAIFNGIKFKTKLGTSADITLTKKIEALLNKSKIRVVEFDKALSQKIIIEADFLKDYIKHLKNFINLSLINKSRIKVIVDAMHGAADSLIEDILKGSKIKLDIINKEPRCDFGGNTPEPIETHLETLKKSIKRGGYDIGLATDGDGDRVAVFSNKGEFINSSEIFALLIVYLLEKKKNLSLAKTVSCSNLVGAIAIKNKLKIKETPIGFKYLAQLMITKEIDIAGEESGGIGLARYLPDRDGLLIQLLCLEMLSFYKKPLDQILKRIKKTYGKTFYRRQDVAFLPKKRKEISKRIKSEKIIKSITKKNIKDRVEIDGIKYILEDNSWILFRFSGTEPVLRIYAESYSLTSTLTMLKKAIRKVI